jgi:hypothetical protein
MEVSRVTRTTRHDTGDDGATFVTLVVASGIVLLLLAGVVQVIVFQYGKGTVRAALDEAVRSGARSTSSVDVCQARAANVLHDLLGGPMGNGVSVTCTDLGDRIAVTARVHFQGWFGSFTDYHTTLTASAAKENQ